VECKAEQCLLKPDVTDKTNNRLNNFIPYQNIMKILSTAGCLNKTTFIQIIKNDSAYHVGKKSLLEYQTVVVAY